MLKPLIYFSCLVQVVLFAVPQTSGAQDSAEPKFIFDTGNPPWKGERLVLPPGFAPDLGWNGVEHIRFAPGMFDFNEPDFFSYVIAFLLSAEADTGEEILEKELLTYYRGLSNAVMGGKGQTVDTGTFSIRLEKDETLKSFPPEIEGGSAYSGILKWTEPFATQKAQTLNLEIFVWKYGDQPVVLSCVSPVARDEEVPWEKLRAIATKFRLEP
ncbi:hypothetical protein VSU19_02440 [Verrucomicrobiales bacterium BCK34]|nr:hypothetical protein [Verrucomicrobiales bacterium BCK34]